jgi:uncharacterized protein (UPF0332 family)
VTPETEEHLDKARKALRKARGLLDVMQYCDDAARAAYLAGFHAAQALISERTGRIAKSHSGVRGTFARLVKDDPPVDRGLVRFPGRAYRFKESPTATPAPMPSSRLRKRRRRSPRPSASSSASGAFCHEGSAHGKSPAGRQRRVDSQIASREPALIAAVRSS